MIKIISTSVIFIIAFLTTAIGQNFHNLDFQQKCDTSKTGLCYWDLSWGAKGSISPTLVDKKKCLLIQGANETSVGFVEQSILFPSSGKSKIITVAAIIKSDSIEGKGAGLNIGLYDTMVRKEIEAKYIL